MSKFHTKLLVALVTLIIIGLLGLEILLGQLFKNNYLETYNERLNKENNLLSMYIENNGGVQSVNHEEVLKVSKMLNVRIAITNTQGVLLFDSGKMTPSTISGIKENINEVLKDKSNIENKLIEHGEYDIHYSWKPILKAGEKEGYLFIITKTDELKDAYSQIWWILSISVVMVLIVFIYLGYRITARYSKPIEAATKAAIELANGNYRARVESNDRNETSMLSTSINVLAQNLQEMSKAQEIQQDRLSALIENMGAGLLLIDSRGFINLINKGYVEIFRVDANAFLDKLYYEVIDQEEISHVIAEVFRTEQKVRKHLLLPWGIERRYFDVYGIPIIGTNNAWKGVLLVFHDITEIKKLEQMRKDFVANVSHELKTPVTSIKGFSETLIDGAMHNQDTLEAFLSIINKESNRMQSLIQDLLDFSKIEQQEFKLNIQDFDLYELIKEVITMLNKKAKSKDIGLELEFNREELYIQGDHDRLKQVLINIISNAILYTPPQGSVKVSLFEYERTVKIHVKDTGVGIEQEEIPRIFERFYRVDRARSRDSGGTGLGLAIVKHLVEAHHGNITVKSTLGKGSEFIIELHKYFK
ncbi:two-component system histidine kinase PnpS [Neobacillus niacini]|jgi:two-component system, OmpR family, phosphate regulon sensor histidine kinase PhoR|uniref:two-component system histidine kinase PnpS n=1 Tax=Neobacillus niacini TaxID=86668 RepID=UPI001C8E313F|nr:ATP-binding protein [Neobacillus niacini]MBY0146607.1 PAS domain-containing protein [Neobacillus niacini]